MEKDQFIRLLESNENLRSDLFIRGFLITDDKKIDVTDFPFYGQWKAENHKKYIFLSHPLTGCHIHEDGKGRCFFLMGHAYDPYTMKIDENEILKLISQNYDDNNYLQIINGLTGIYLIGVITDTGIYFLVDAAGIQSACCGIIGNAFYCSSHAQLIGDICNLEMDPLVKELIAYKWYGRVMGPYLPGDLTPFSILKRIIPGIRYTYSSKIIEHKRFWPLEHHNLAEVPEEYDEIIRKSSELLKKNMILVSRKWKKPWISLTGGIDSNTTFAAANGIYDKFDAFSYISAPKEVPDTEAAAQIAKQFNMKHHIFMIPEKENDLEQFNEILEVLRHNNGYVAEPPINEARKRVYLRRNASCDVEVKSWVSETIRGYWYKHFGRNTMPKLSGKLFRNLYKIFITERSLAHKIDNLFNSYLADYEYDKIPSCYPPADMHFNDVTWGSWGSINVSEMKYCFDLTIIYNNRNLLELLFQIPLEKRISDQHHLDMKKYLNKELYDMNIRVVNMKETNFRAFALNCIFNLNRILP